MKKILKNVGMPFINAHKTPIVVENVLQEKNYPNNLNSAEKTFINTVGKAPFEAAKKIIEKEIKGSKISPLDEICFQYLTPKTSCKFKLSLKNFIKKTDK